MSIKDFFMSALMGPALSEDDRREREEVFWIAVLTAPVIAAGPYCFVWLCVLLAEFLGLAPT